MQANELGQYISAWKQVRLLLHGLYVQFRQCVEHGVEVYFQYVESLI